MSLNKNQEGILQLLTTREKQVYDSLLKGNTDLEIGEELNISINTVKSHVKNIYQKLHAKNRLEAAFLYYKTN